MIKLLRGITLIELMMTIAIVGIILAIVLGGTLTNESEIIEQEGNCIVKRKIDRGSKIYITVCNGVITNVSSRN